MAVIKNTSIHNNSTKMKIVIMLAFLLFSVEVYAACTGSSPTWTSTPDYTSVSSCVSQASPEDTINVSAGSATWNSRLEILTAVNLIGAGIGETIITRGSDIVVLYRAGTDVETNYNFRVSGFTFELGGSGQAIFLQCDKTDTQQTNIRVDHNLVTNSDESGAGVENCDCWGVVDNNQFTNLDFPLRVWGDSVTAGSQNWADQPNGMTLGSGDNWYIEDNIFTNLDSAFTDGDASGRWAVRYNTIQWKTENANTNFFDLHNSCFGLETYGNRITHLGKGIRMTSHRGGRMAAFYNNVITGGTSKVNMYDNEGQSGYPLENMKHNNDYIWLNRHDADGAILDSQVSSNDGGFIVEEETFWADSANPTTSPLETGIGYGTLAQRPAECTEGVAYWATDQSTTDLTGLTGDINTYPSRATIEGTLYKCGESNVWTAYFTPYTYPHPLRLAPLEPPSNLRIIQQK